MFLLHPQTPPPSHNPHSPPHPSASSRGLGRGPYGLQIDYLTCLLRSPRRGPVSDPLLVADKVKRTDASNGWEGLISLYVSLPDPSISLSALADMSRFYSHPFSSRGSKLALGPGGSCCRGATIRCVLRYVNGPRRDNLTRAHHNIDLLKARLSEERKSIFSMIDVRAGLDAFLRWGMRKNNGDPEGGFVGI